jgi:CHAT domain-containing protein
MISARRGDRQAALAAFRNAVNAAVAQDNAALEAIAWDHLGNELLQQNRLPEAEHALEEGFRLRLFHHHPDVFLSYSTLAELKRRQGDLRTARSLIEEAIAGSLRQRRSIPLYVSYHQRGEIRQAQGDLMGALSDFRESLDLARRWRLDLIPADSVRTGTDVGLHEILCSFIDAGNSLYFKTRNEALATETLVADEESRAASLREKRAEGREVRRRLPKEYWAKLAELRTAESPSDAAETPALREKKAHLRLELTEMESAVGVPTFSISRGSSENIPFKNSPINLHRELADSEAFLSFHLGQRNSYLWSVTRRQLHLYRLGSRRRLADQAVRFADAVRRGLPDAETRGSELYRMLFSSLDSTVLSKRHWLLALDDTLFEAPLAAIVIGHKDGKSVYLIERHSIQLVPSALLLSEHGRRTTLGRFVGIGDAIYNTADPRWRQDHAGRSGGFFTLFPSLQANPQQNVTQLGRLVSSGPEIQACARTVSRGGTGLPPVMLSGKAANFTNFRRALSPVPGVIHLATHMLELADGEPRIALSLRQSGLEMVSATDVSMLRIPGSLVVMSGCSSGAGKILPGAGLLGLSRAWLAAGANGVVASHWPTPDDTGELFQAFYRRIRGVLGGRSVGGAAEGLREAQLDMLRSGGWRAAPGYWAAYFSIGGTR